MPFHLPIPLLLLEEVFCVVFFLLSNYILLSLTFPKGRSFTPEGLDLPLHPSRLWSPYLSMDWRVPQPLSLCCPSGWVR